MAKKVKSLPLYKRNKDEFTSVTDHPLISAKDNDPVLSLFVPPELHLNLGVGNKLADALNAKMGGFMIII